MIRDATNDESRSLRDYSRVLLALLVLGAGLRGVGVWRGVDGSVRDAWREPDMAAMARNFYRETMNPLDPRIDWRGDGPGSVEAELPVISWTAALIYHVTGERDWILRAITWSLSVASLLLLAVLARSWLPTRAALAAVALFALSPLAVREATTIHPEALMLPCYLAAIGAFVAWLETGRSGCYLLALAATTLAILAKLPAAHLGLVFAPLCFMRYGWRAVARPGVWLFAIIALGIPALWYAHAHSIWLTHGNSLGMSNEAYGRITSLSFLKTLPTMVLGVAWIELRFVWAGCGALLGLAGLIHVTGAKSEMLRKYPILSWGAALFAFFIVTGRTTGEDWAAHYHIVATPWAALVAGWGVEWFVRLGKPLLLATLMTSLGLIAHDHTRPRHEDLYAAAVAFREYVPSNVLIIASGDKLTDRYGLASAHNAPYMFYWTDRKGFTLADEEQRLSKLEEFRRRGARYFLAERERLSKTPGFESELRAHYRILAEHDSAILVELIPQYSGG